MKWMAVVVFAVSLAAQSYKVQTPAGVVEMPVEAYVAGVVAGESSVFRSDEALKAMAIAARSYAERMRGRHAYDGFDFCSLTHCQRYLAPSDRSTRAARDTAGQRLWFNGKPAFCVYSRSCGGETENVSEVWPDVEAPYLVSHVDPYCSRRWNWSDSTDQIAAALRQAGLKAPAHLRSISVVKRDGSGRARMLSLDGALLSASSFHFAMGRFIGWNTIRSELYSVETSGGQVMFRGKGEGHGVGLCQRGADQMGLAGENYREILAFYYPGATLRAQDLKWHQLSGEGVALYTLEPEQDRDVIGLAEDVARRWRGRLPWPLPAHIDIYIYPDLDAFRNATGEPGWVAARTVGKKIELQPVTVLRKHHALRSTVEHEMVHCFVEAAARAGLPVWFREGLVEHLTGRYATRLGDAPVDEALRQRQNRQVAADGYRLAQGRVEALVSRYGEGVVLSWVVRGLPADVKNSTASKPAVKTR